MSPVVAKVALVVVASSIAFSASADVPTIDIQQTCGIAAKAMIQLMGGSSEDSDRNICLGSEQGARAQMSKDWATYPAEDKSRCVQTEVYLPSYVEWLTCFEMERDVRKMGIARRSPMAPITLPHVKPGVHW
jgi:hypothetical protein